MNIDDFKTILLIQSIENTVFKLKDNIKKHQERVTLIIKKETVAKEEKTCLEEELKAIETKMRTLEKELALSEKELNLANSHISDVKTQKEETSLKHQIENSSKKCSELENKIIESLEFIDQLKEQIKTKTSFLTGIKDTITQITKEVETDCASEEKEINNYKTQRKNLLETVDHNMKNLYLNLKKRFIGKSAASFLKDKSCESCGIEVPSHKEASLEVQNNIELCSGCGRLLLPQSVKA